MRAHQGHACRFHRLGHGVGLVEREAQRFLAKDVLARRSRSHDGVFVQVVREADVDSVDARRCDELAKVLEDLELPKRSSMAASAIGVDVGDGGHLRVLGSQQVAVNVVARDVAAADDADADLPVLRHWPPLKYLASLREVHISSSHVAVSTCRGR